jgi:hypothetical protein
MSRQTALPPSLQPRLITGEAAARLHLRVGCFTTPALLAVTELDCRNAFLPWELFTYRRRNHRIARGRGAAFGLHRRDIVGAERPRIPVRFAYIDRVKVIPRCGRDYQGW